MGDLIAPAKTAGVSIEQLGASYAILTASGINAAKSSTMIESLLDELSASGSKTDKILREVAGGSFVELMKQGKSVGDVLQILSQHAEKSGLTLKDLFSSSVAGNAALALMKGGADGFNGTLKEMTNSAGACDKAFEQLNNTTEKKVSRAFSSFKNLLSDIGVAISPVVGKLADLATNIANTASEFVNAHPNITTFAVALAGIAAAVGPALLAIGSIIKIIPTLKNGFDAVKNGISMLKTGFTMLQGAITAVAAIGAGPLLAIAAGIAAIAGAVILWKNYGDEIKAKATEVFNNVKETVSNAWNSIQESVSTVWDNITTTLGEIWNNIATSCTEVFNSLKEVVSNAWNGIVEFTSLIWNNLLVILSNIWIMISTTCTTVFTSLRDIVLNAWNGIVEFTSSLWTSILTTLTSIWTSIKTACAPYFNAIKTTVTNIWNAIKSVTTTIWNSIKNVIQTTANAVKNVVQVAWNAVKSITTTIWNGIKAVIQTVWNTIKSLSTANTNQVKSIIQNGFNQLKAITQTAWNNVVNAIKTAWNNIKSAVTSGANAVKSACSSAFSGIKEILVSPFRAARDAISGILGGIKSKISSIASFGRRSMPARAMVMDSPMLFARAATVSEGPTFYARSGGIVGDLESVQSLIKKTFPDNGDDLIEKFAKAGKEAGESYVEELRKLEPIVSESINRMTKDIETRTKTMVQNVIASFSQMSNRINSYMRTLCNSTINYWNQMKASLSQPIKGEIIVTHRDIYIEERPTEKSAANSVKKMLFNTNTETVRTLQDNFNMLTSTNSEHLKIRQEANSINIKNSRQKSNDIDYERLGKTIAKYQKGDVKIENTYNSPKPASIKELKRQDEIMLRRLKKQKKI